MPAKPAYPLAVLDSCEMLLNEETLLQDGGTYRIVYEHIFPEQFKVQPEYKADHKLVGLAPILEQAMRHIEENINKTTQVPPLMIASPALSGKTTTLQQLFNTILQGGKYTPILVSARFFRNTEAIDDEDFIRAVVTQLDPNAMAGGRITYFSQQRLNDYLQSAKKPVVLLVDDLQTLSTNLSSELIALLRKMFLDQEGRYLCFTGCRGTSLEDRGELVPPITMGVARTLDVGTYCNR